MAIDWEAEREFTIAAAHDLGFAAAGVAGLRPFGTARRRALAAIDAGRMQGMPWFTRERVLASTDLGPRYPWARSILALALEYAPVLAAGDDPGRGRMSSYACLQGDAGTPVDYHDLLARRCDALVGALRERHPELRAKRFVDHGWAMDRAIAKRAGIGFTGKNSQLITREAGSYVLLVSLLLSLPLPESSPSKRGCGHCTACIPACPTGAIVAPGVIDARRCISYLTIEHRGPIEPELRPLIGSWIFGCDLCQEACPINDRRAPQPLAAGGRSTGSGPVPEPDLIECLELDDAEFTRRFRHTAVWRTGRAGLARNAAIALGNSGDGAAPPALQRAARDDPDEVVREAAQWAIGRLQSPDAPVPRPAR